MKKSSQVPASLIIAMAAVSVTGCNSGGYDECVDAYGRMLPDSACRSNYSGAHFIHRSVQTGGFGSSGSSGGGFFGG